MAHYYQKIVSPWKRTDPKSKTVNTEVFSDDYIEMLKDIQWIGTEKIDGENLNFYYDGNHFSYFGHTDKSVFAGDKRNGWIHLLHLSLSPSLSKFLVKKKLLFMENC